MPIGEKSSIYYNVNTSEIVSEISEMTAEVVVHVRLVPCGGCMHPDVKD